MAGTPQEQRLMELLVAHGAGSNQTSGFAAWEAFKAYGREVFGEPGVGLLIQMGTFSFTGKPLFYFEPLCQFEILDSEGEHDHFEQLHCELTTPPTSELQGISSELWSFDFSTADDFYIAVESMPSFQIAVRQSAYACAVTHEEV